MKRREYTCDSGCSLSLESFFLKNFPGFSACSNTPITCLLLLVLYVEITVPASTTNHLGRCILE